MLTTSTFIIRNLKKSDGPQLLEWYKTQTGSYFLLGHLGLLSDLELAKLLKNKFRKEYIIENKEKRPVGLIKFQYINQENKTLEIHLALLENKYANQDYLREIIKAVAENLSKLEQMRNLRALLLEGEKEYQQAFDSCGFKITGVLREHFYFNQQYHNLIFMNLKAEDFNV